MREVNEANYWLRSARKLMDASSKDREKYTVVVAQCIHSIIRANDALSVHFLKKRAVRHDDAARLFLELIEGNKIPSTYAYLRKTLNDAVQLKSKVDYKGMEMGKADAERWISRAEKFLNAAKESLIQKGSRPF